MRVPEGLVSLVEQGIIEEVLRPLMSGKEAQIYLVRAYGEHHVAKIYKEAQNRTFKHRSEYTEGRRVRNSRDQRALGKRSSYGKARQEESWRDVEADVIYRLRDVGVRVPEPKAYVDNVLVMELVTNGQGEPAARLAELTFDSKEAEELYTGLIADVQKMLCAGLVHGDLSEFNILAGRKGAVIIDFPQAVDASTNRNARKLLIRDVGNLVRFFGRFTRELRSLRHAEEMWDLYERGDLSSETVLTGHFKQKKEKVEVSGMLAEILELERENKAQREALGLPPARPARQPRFEVVETIEPRHDEKPKAKHGEHQELKPGRSRRRRRPGSGAGPKPGPKPENREAPKKAAGASAGPEKPRRRRRRRRKPGAGPAA